MSRFVARHKHEWEELEGLLRQARKGTRRMTSEELSRLDQLYRRTTIHLARVSSWTDDRPLADYLNRLTATAHSVVYLPPRKSPLDGLARFVTEGFARCVWRNGRAHLLSAAMMLLGAILGYAATRNDVALAQALATPGDVRQPGASAEQLMASLRSGRDQGGGEKFLFASFLFQHNFKVGLLAMASGVLAGVPSVLLMGFNGMLLGAFVGVHHDAGIGHELWAWLLPHGITELGAIVLCGGVGMMLGRAVLNPGSISRVEALRQAGQEAARTAAGVGIMLVLAAIIESYVRQSNWGDTTRLVFAAATAVAWVCYLAHGASCERKAAFAERAPSEGIALASLEQAARA
jgi:uncharacterized membrane protein SpoIIM required for sporulation